MGGEDERSGGAVAWGAYYFSARHFVMQQREDLSATRHPAGGGYPFTIYSHVKECQCLANVHWWWWSFWERRLSHPTVLRTYEPTREATRHESKAW